MHTIGDMGDRHIILGFIGPQEVPHLARNLPVQLGDPIALSGYTQCQHRHTERFSPRIVLRAMSMN